MLLMAAVQINCESVDVGASPTSNYQSSHSRESGARLITNPPASRAPLSGAFN